MGNLQAEEFAAIVGRGELQLEQALTWHLQSNHYPPVPVRFVPVCKRAIELANRGEWNVRVALPKGCSYKGTRYAPVSAIVEQHHLDTFIHQEESQ